MALTQFHPACQAWFQNTLGEPTPAQSQAWPAIQAGKHTLIAAPTGSGKTLAAFYTSINALVQEAQSQPLPAQTRVLYLSPLKALGNDIERNLRQPLAGIEDELFMQGQRAADIRVAVRTGDTSASERQKMLRQPPHILVTTPESVYLLLTSTQGRRLLATVTTVIIDEIHAMLGDKRGSHLALSLERLQALVKHPLQRIGLSATQKPLSLVANYLVGNREEHCEIIDTGHQRKLDIRLGMPDSPLTALMSNDVWGELYEQLVALIQQHQTTLVFVNTRRLSERLALALSERLGSDALYGDGAAGLVSSHHGSMSKERRHHAEQQLKAGKLKVLVATASMELGIDIGSVDLVVQFSSPLRIATFLQRIGRSGHQVGGVPKGVLFPLTRDDLVECTALIDSIHQGELDKILMPEQPADILAQQLVAEIAARQDESAEGNSCVEELFHVMCSAWPYRDLERDRYDKLLSMLCEGYATRLGRRGAWLHLDRVNARVSARRGARLTALTNGGAIPDMFDYQVVLDPDDQVVGTLNEDFALETLPGDIFTLGSHAWQLMRVDGLKVRVRDAVGQKPTVPFWFGEGPGRSAELSVSVSRLREVVDELLMEQEETQVAGILAERLSLPVHAMQQLVEYLAIGRRALGVMPTQKNIVMERFFDDVGDMHVVIHAPFGSRHNRAWGLALRKRFCRSFNFELQAAANEDSIVISLGSVHSFVLDEVFKYLNSASAKEVLTQALLDAPMFEVRWRWNATRALAIQRNRSGKRVPPQFQRMDAEDLVAQVFPDQLACQENLTGERTVPDHPLVQQTIDDCLTEAMDVDGLLSLLEQMESGSLNLLAMDLREPSPFAQEIINARPYAFLDDAPFEERRTFAIRNRSWQGEEDAGHYGHLDESAITRVTEEAWPLMRDAEELHDALYTAGFFVASELSAGELQPLWQTLQASHRVCSITINSEQSGCDAVLLHVAAEVLPLCRLVWPACQVDREPVLPDELLSLELSREEAVKQLIQRRLSVMGPVTARELSGLGGLSLADTQQALLALQSEGFAFCGQYSATEASNGVTAEAEQQWCERRLLQRIHRYTLESHRERIKPVSLQAWTMFLFDRHELRIQSLVPRPQALPSGAESEGLLERVCQLLDGVDAPAASWEGDILPARLSFYDPSWLDKLCSSGRLTWGRYRLTTAISGARSATTAKPRKSATPIKNTPVSLAARSSLGLWLKLAGEAAGQSSLSHNAESVLIVLKEHGASFFHELQQDSRLMPVQVEEALAELVAAGRVTSDTFTGLRALLTPSSQRGGRSRRRSATYQAADAGRWSLIRRPREVEALSDGERTELIGIYIRRWGVLSRQIIAREVHAPPWRELLPVLRTMELRGQLRGGRFIAGMGGEQFAHPDDVKPLRKSASALAARQSAEIDWEGAVYHSLSACDPVNHLAILLPEVKLARVVRNRVLFQNGTPIAVLEGAKVRLLREVPEQFRWAVEQLLRRQELNPRLRSYLGRAGSASTRP